MKKLLMVCIFSVLISCCIGCRREESGLPQEGTENMNMTERIEESLSKEKEETATEASGYIDVGGILAIKELEGYTYEIRGTVAGTVEHPFTAYKKNEDDGSVTTLEMRRSRWRFGGVPYREVKKASYLISWSLDLLDGTLEEYKELSEGMGRSIYLYEKRQPVGISGSGTSASEYGYRAIYGMDGSYSVYIIDFPVNTPFEEAEEFLDSIQAGPELFSASKTLPQETGH